MDKFNSKTIKIIILSLAGVTILLIVGYLLLSWNKPLNQALNLLGDPSNNEGRVGTLETQTVDPGAPTLEPVCGGPPSMNVLISGVASANYLYGLADAVRIARIDFQNPNVTVLALPRDLWVEIPGLESRGISAGKLNQAYFYGTEGMGYYSGTGYGSGLLAETILHNYGYRVDNYLAVSLSSFRTIIDTLDGIDVYLAGDVYKRVNDQPELYLKAGSHHLNGKQAEMLARQRISIGDFGRINNQTVILKAVAVKMLSPTGIKAIPDLFEQFKSNIQTDLSPAEITQLVCLAGMLDYDKDLNFITLPTELMVESMVFDPARGINTAALVGDEAKIRNLMMEFQEGIWP
ncbi:MAG: LCP family protein [Anaerolineales bacterium]|nr:LCP family protein [Anaerolineales bacterium]